MSILITGAGGQDGRLLSRKLLAEGRKVTGICRPGHKPSLSQYSPGLDIIELDLGNENKLVDLLDFAKPDEIYNLAGFSSVNQSWKNPSLVTTINSVVPATILKWCVEKKPTTRVLQASSSEIFGGSTVSPQNELTEHSPITPYGLSKSFSHTLVQQFRYQYGIHASNVILYNHESPLRDIHFVTRKITQSVAAIARGSKEPIRLGHIYSQRDWGWAPDYVDGMHKVIQQTSPGDFILATGITHTVADVLNFAFKHIGISDFSDYIIHDEKNDRNADPINLVGNISLASQQLNWLPTLNLEEIIATMVDYDLKLIEEPATRWYPKF